MVNSYNGWYAAADLPTVVIEPVPGGRFRVNTDEKVQKIFDYLVKQFDKRVEPVVGAVLDDWSYTFKKNTNNPNSWSCHASATAIDLNALKHPNGTKATSNFTAAQIKEVKAILNELGGTVKWLENNDPMHFEIALPPGQLFLPDVLKGGQAPSPQPTPTPSPAPSPAPSAAPSAAPPFPLNDPQVFGTYNEPGWADKTRSGDSRWDGEDIRASVRLIQGQLNKTYTSNSPALALDGVFGPATRRDVVLFQNLKGLPTDGLVGRNTWAALWS